MSWIKAGLTVAKLGYKAFKAYKKNIKTNKNIKKAKDLLEQAKNTNHIHGGWKPAMKFALKQEKKIVRKKAINALMAKIKKIK